MRLRSLLIIGSFAFVCSGNAAIANAADDAAAKALLKESKCNRVKS